MDGMDQSITLPLTVNRASAGGTYRSDDIIHFEDPIASVLIATGPVQRLAGIGFLGAIDYIRRGSGRSPNRRRHNRLEHSIGVAHLADIYARSVELPESRRFLLIAAALLHDVGHGPLSHSLEPIFDAEFGIDHHAMTHRIVTGETSMGHEIPDLLSDYQIDIDELLALIDGEHDGDVGFLFSGQINLDTLDGITRCRAFMAPHAAPGFALSTVRKWAVEGRPPLTEFDTFWELKHEIYNLFIDAPHGAIFDAIAQIYMRSELASFSPDDFFLTGRNFRKRHRPLFAYLGHASRSRNTLCDRVPPDWVNQEIILKERSFFVCRDVEPLKSTSINQRYKKTKRSHSKIFAELMAEAQ